MKLKSSDLPSRLKKADAVGLSVTALIDGLSATKSYQQDGKLVTVVDHTARIKSAELLLNHAVGKPVERQQVITAKVSPEAVDRVALRETIEQKLAALVNRPGITMDELLQARRILSEVEKASEEVKPLNEDQLVLAAKRIHGMGGPAEDAVTREDELKALDQKIASLEEARKALEAAPYQPGEQGNP